MCSRQSQSTYYKGYRILISLQYVKMICNYTDSVSTLSVTAKVEKDTIMGYIAPPWGHLALRQE